MQQRCLLNRHTFASPQSARSILVITRITIIIIIIIAAMFSIYFRCL